MNREDRKQKGLCLWCNNPRVNKRSYCQKCLDKKKLTNKLRKNRKAQGICRECKKPIFNNSLYCEEHLIKSQKAINKWKEIFKEKINEYGRIRYWNNIYSGLCPKCGNKLAENRNLCEECLRKDRFRKLRGKSNDN